MPAGVHGKAGFDTRSLAVSIKRLGNSRQLLSPARKPAANAGGTTCNLWVPGSSPGHAFTGAIAQLGRATDMFLHRSSPQVSGRKSLNHFAANAEGTTWVPGSSPGCSTMITGQ